MPGTGEQWKPSNFGPVPGGSTILWQTEHFVMYADSKGKCWRYIHEFHARWPVEFIPPIHIPGPVQDEPKPGERKLTPQEIEDLI